MKSPVPAFMVLLSVLSCTVSEPADSVLYTTISFDCGRPCVKSSDPSDESLISDINLFVFNSVGGELERNLFVSSREQADEISVPLLKGAGYDIYACINFGYRVSGISKAADLEGLRYHLIYPDEYRQGVPMAAKIENFVADSSGRLSLKAERMMAKIVLTIDRSLLAEDVTMAVRQARIGGCPRSMSPFRESRPEGRSDVFKNGFGKLEAEVDNLNRDKSGGRSGEVNLYMLESLSGPVPASVKDPSAAGIYPYIELEISYKSAKYYTKPGQWLVYRFCIGDEEGLADIRRNTLYRFTVRPEGTGIDEFSWRVDKDALAEYQTLSR